MELDLEIREEDVPYEVNVLFIVVDLASKT